MSKITDRIFHGEAHKLSSPYGARSSITTSAGKTAAFHNGADYSTGGKKIPQYAVEDGYIISCGKDSAANGYALYAWVGYPRLGVKMLHYHLDSIKVKKGQTVDENTIIGNTGMTGKATGVHLHLEIKNLSTNERYDPEAYAKKYSPPAKIRKFKVKQTTPVRKGPGTAYKSVVTAKKGDVIKADRLEKNKFGNVWVHTEKGYVNAAKLSEVTT